MLARQPRFELLGSRSVFVVTSFLLVFVAGQAAAWFYLRTGRTWVGGLGTAALWSLLDWWLLARYVFAHTGAQLTVPLVALLGTALALVAMLAVARWRRRWSAVAKERTTRFAAGLAEYLRSDYEAARATFQRLVRVDPWDTVAWIALGDVFGRSGDPRRAQRCYRRAAAVDVRADFADLLQHHRRPPT